LNFKNLKSLPGLILAVTTLSFILLYGVYEKSYDRLHENYSRIFRAEGKLVLNEDQDQFQAMSPIPLAPTLVKELPEIEQAVRISRPYSKALLSVEDKLVFSESQGIWADNSLFEVFSFPFLKGDKLTALAQPLSIVLTETLASKCFPGEDPLGKSVKINQTYDYRITGVIRDIPENSHLRFNFVVSSDFSGTLVGSWDASTVFTYVLLDKPGSAAQLKTRLRSFLKDHGALSNKEVYLKQISDIHLGADIYFEFSHNNDRRTVNLFFLTAMLIMLIVCLSLLSTAISDPLVRSLAENQEEGKKFPRFEQLKPLYSNALFLALITVICSFILTIVLLPEFGTLINRKLTFSSINILWLLFELLLVLLLVVLIYALLPVYVVSSYLNIKRRSSENRILGLSTLIRRISRVFQLGALFIFIVVFWTAFKRVDRLEDVKYGIDKENIIILDFSYLSREDMGKCQTLKNELLNNPGVLDVSFSLTLPFKIHGTSAIGLDGVRSEDRIMVNVNMVNLDFFDTYGLELAQGDVAELNNAEGAQWRCLINEAAARNLEIVFAIKESENLLGKRLVFGPGNRPVISGIVKDFPFSYLKNGIKPLVLIYQQNNQFIYPKMSLRLYSGDKINTLNFIKNRFNVLFRGDAFDFKFFKDDYSRMYQDEKILRNMFAFFTAIALLIILLGLLSSGLIKRLWNTKYKQQSGLAAVAHLYRWGIWIILYFYLLVKIEPELFYYGFGRIMELPFFSRGGAFLKASLSYPGGMVDYINGFLAQGFYYPWLGALIIVLSAWLFYCSALRLFKLAGTVVPEFFSLIPVLLYIVIYNRYGFALSLGIALVLALIFILGYERAAPVNFWGRMIFFTVCVTFLFYFAAGASLIFAVLVVLFEVFKRKKYLLAGTELLFALMVPYLSYLFIFDHMLEDIYLHLLPFHPDQLSNEYILIAQILFLFFPGAILASFLWKRFGKTKPLKIKRAFSYVGIVLLCAVTLGTSFDRNKKSLFSIISFSHLGLWPQVLDQARKLPSNIYNAYSNYQTNYALYYTGRMLDDFFSYVQQLDSIVMVPWGTERYITRVVSMSDTSEKLGALNIAENLNLELMEVTGDSPFYRWRLAHINIAKEQPETARVFLQALQRDLIYGARAAEMLQRLKKDPSLGRNDEVRYLRAQKLNQDFANIDVENLYLELLRSNKYNKMAFEYLMAYYLMTRQVDKIADNIENFRYFGYEKLPRHLEEALCIHALNTSSDFPLQGWQISQETRERFSVFSDIMSSQQIQDKEAELINFSREYGGNYFLYYSFEVTGVMR